MNDVMKHEADKMLFDRGLTCQEANRAFNELYEGLRPGITEEDLDYAFRRELSDGDSTVSDAVSKARRFWAGKQYVVSVPEKPSASEIMAAAVVLASNPDAVVSFGNEEGVEPNAILGSSSEAWGMACGLACHMHPVPGVFEGEFRKDLERNVFAPLDEGEERMKGLKAFLEGMPPDLAVEAAVEYLDAELSRRCGWYVAEESLLMEMSKQSGGEVLLLDSPWTDWSEHLETMGDGFSAVAWNSGGGVWKAMSLRDRAAMRLRGTVGQGPWTVVSLDGRSGEFKAENAEEAAKVMEEWGDEKDEID